MDRPNPALVERAQRKDADAFAALIRAYERVALSVAFGVLVNRASAADVVQDAFIRAWQRISDLREPERFGPWLCGIVRNLAIDCLRRRKPAELLTRSVTLAEPDRWTTDPTNEVVRRETHASVGEAIASLDELSRVVVTMRYYEDLSSKEIADLLGLSPAAVDMRLSRIRKQLKAMLQDEPKPATAESP